MGLWILVAAVIVLLLGYVAWELRWYLTTLRRSFRSESGPEAAAPGPRELAGSAGRR